MDQPYRHTTATIEALATELRETALWTENQATFLEGVANASRGVGEQTRVALREQARKDLPLSTYTEAYWKVDLHNLLHFLRLRMDEHAQLEIREYADTIGNRRWARWPRGTGRTTCRGIPTGSTTTSSR